jgi:hypothetical protein
MGSSAESILKNTPTVPLTYGVEVQNVRIDLPLQVRCLQLELRLRLRLGLVEVRLQL